MNLNKTSVQGFTLVELAIVLMIIGLLIGGILRGQELIRNSRITSIIEQTKAYSGAVHSFMDAYNNIPGDFSLASSHLPGCEPGNANNCVNGNGDGVVGVLAAGQGVFANEPWQMVDSSIASENVQFWKQLALAHLITGVNPAANTIAWGISQPVTNLTGGFFVRYTNFNVGGYPPWTGHIIVLNKDITATTYDAVSPLTAAQIDRKMDDGMANSGDMRAVSPNWNAGCGNPNQGPNDATGYAGSSENPTCIIMFKIF